MHTLAMGSLTLIVPEDVVMIVGPRIVGYIFHFILFGVLSLQVYIYASAFPRDVLINKVFVYAVYLLEVAQSIMMSYTAFQVFAVGYGNVPGYDKIGITWFSIPLISGLVGFLAQAFYAYRLSILSRSWVVASVVLGLAIIHLGGAIATAMIFKQTGYFSKLFGQHYLITAGIWNGGGALCDLIICISMAYYLSRRGNGGFKPTQAMLRRLIRLVIETGMVTAVIAILNFILSLMPHHPAFSETTSEILAEVYANSMMVVFNARVKALAEETEMPVPVRPQLQYSSPNAPREYGLENGVTVTTEEVVFPDDAISISSSTATKLEQQMSQIARGLPMSSDSRPKSYISS